MEKKKNIRNKVCAGLLALTLAGAPLTLVSAEEQIVSEEAQTEIQTCGLKKQFVERHAHKYVGKDDKDFIWLMSEEPTIGDYQWTDESIKLSDYLLYIRNLLEKSNSKGNFGNYVFPCLGDDVYALYGIENNEDSIFCPIKTGEDNQFEDKFKYNRHIVIKLSEEEIEILNNLNLINIRYNHSFMRLFDLFDMESESYLFFSVEIKDDNYVINELVVDTLSEYQEKYEEQYPYFLIEGIIVNKGYKTNETYTVSRNNEDSKILVKKLNINK